MGRYDGLARFTLGFLQDAANLFEVMRREQFTPEEVKNYVEESKRNKLQAATIPRGKTEVKGAVRLASSKPCRPCEKRKQKNAEAERAFQEAKLDRRIRRIFIEYGMSRDEAKKLTGFLKQGLIEKKKDDDNRLQRVGSVGERSG